MFNNGIRNNYTKQQLQITINLQRFWSIDMCDALIKPDVIKYANIQKELTRLFTTIRKLKYDKAEVEAKIQKHMTEKNLDILTVGDTEIINQNVLRREKKPKNDKLTDGAHVLADVSDEPDKMLEKILQSMQGEKIETKALKIKKTNK